MVLLVVVTQSPIPPRRLRVGVRVRLGLEVCSDLTGSLALEGPGCEIEVQVNLNLKCKFKLKFEVEVNLQLKLKLLLHWQDN